MSIVAVFIMCLHSMFGVQHGYTSQQIHAAEASAYQASGVGNNGSDNPGLIVVADTLEVN
ncbi:MAG TPA: hypothetical protein VEW28_00840 [Candidatus Kapabacteria bacterium]|nr:hypothetical protein [Candidatus Kapabacteria bacterium]